MLDDLVRLGVGLVLLAGGAELLVRGASNLGRMAGLSPLVIGLTIVAYGTSAPELAVTISAGLEGQGSIALGNVVGSNVFNVLLILGGSALLSPLRVDAQLVRVDAPLVVALSLLVWLLAADGVLDGLDGGLLLAAAAGYTVWTFRTARREAGGPAENASALEHPPAPGAPGDPVGHPAEDGGRPAGAWFPWAALVLIGLALLVLGSQLLVAGAVGVASALGVGETLIGLTVVAAGTSLPELATSLVATARGDTDIAVGNAIGSNVFNLTLILGTAGVVSVGQVRVPPAFLTFDLPVMVAVMVACLPVFFTGHRISRWEGAVFVFYYVAYTVVIVLEALGHWMQPLLASALLGFVLPLTGFTLLVAVARSWRARREAAARR